jgi:1-acyl-sn-glycerol-3-phosphate acyltransferase
LARIDRLDHSADSNSDARQQRPDLLAAAAGRSSLMERLQLRFIRRTFEPGVVDRSLRMCQRYVGSTWIHLFTRNLVRVHGLERLPALDPARSFICVCNHRSFFDLYVVTGELVRRGMPHRLAFPVRANFFYDSALGFFVNGIMSFFAMYPPIFRERRRASLNVVSLEELTWLLRRGGTFAGLHPEGTRKKDGDPYTFLPAQAGVGRVIHEAGVTVLPVFINGLGNDLRRQVASNFDGTGTPIVIVFGRPVDFEGLIEQRGSPRVHRAVAERALAAIFELGAEERRLRRALVHSSS